MKSEFIYTENGDLKITKPNGLTYEFNNVDAPELGFEYDMIVYSDVEVKIVKWNEELTFDSQEHVQLTDEEKDAIELYIENSEPPLGHSLNKQYIDQLNSFCHENVDGQLQIYGFDNVVDVLVAGREGSAHPRRSHARRVLEYVDAVWCCYQQIEEEIFNTREDYLKDINEYFSIVPQPLQAPDSQNRT